MLPCTGPRLPIKAAEELPAACQDAFAGACHRGGEQLHELRMGIGRRCRVVDRDEVDARAGLGLKRQSQAEKVRRRFRMRASEAGRNPRDPDMFRTRIKQSDAHQVRGQLRSDRQDDLAARYLILVSNPVGQLQGRIAVEQFVLEVSDRGDLLSRCGQDPATSDAKAR